ncbi:MAG: efflux RND transporter periplasmic adaptor subunit [Bacteroidia bacterium]|nr:efflux RND transporter periplasmic adaptor subunit [Bacteroidia bacterium]
MKNPYIILFLLILQACNADKENSSNSEPSKPSQLTTLTVEQMKRSGIEVGTIEKRDLSSLIQVSGIIDVPPQNMISVTFPPGGYLKSTKLLPGMHIRKGDELAIMEDRGLIQLQQEYLNAVIKGKQLELEFRRQNELNESKSTSDKQFQEAETAYKINLITVKSLSEQLLLAGIDPSKLTENNISKSVALRSPIDGFVTNVKVNIGTYVNPSDILFELVDPRDILLNVTVFEKDIRYLEIGQKIMTWTNSSPDKKQKAEIILIGKELDENRSVAVHCHFKNYDNSLLPGMFMNASIQVNQQNVAAVPEEAVITWQDKPYLFIPENNNSFRMIHIKTGMKQDGFVEVIPESGNSLPEKIVTKGAYTLLMQLMNKAEE